MPDEKKEVSEAKDTEGDTDLDAFIKLNFKMQKQMLEATPESVDDFVKGDRIVEKFIGKTYPDICWRIYDNSVNDYQKYRKKLMEFLERHSSKYKDLYSALSKCFEACLDDEFLDFRREKLYKQMYSRFSDSGYKTTKDELFDSCYPAVDNALKPIILGLRPIDFHRSKVVFGDGMNSKAFLVCLVLRILEQQMTFLCENKRTYDEVTRWFDRHKKPVVRARDETSSFLAGEKGLPAKKVQKGSDDK